MGEGGGGPRVGAGHDDWVEAHCCDGRREDRQDAPDLCAGSVCAACDDGDYSDGGELRWTAGEHHAHPQLRRGRHDGGKPQRLAVLDGARHCAGMALYAAGGGVAVRKLVLAVQQICALRGTSCWGPGTRPQPREMRPYILPEPMSASWLG